MNQHDWMISILIWGVWRCARCSQCVDLTKSTIYRVPSDDDTTVQGNPVADCDEVVLRLVIES